MKVKRKGIGFLVAVVLFAGAGLSLFSQAELLSDSKLLAQKAAIKDLSGDDPFVLRQNWWKGIIEPGQAKLIQIQLFKRNDYRFWFAVPGRDAEISIHLYDGKGNLVETERTNFPAKNVVGTMISAESTGLYFVRIYLSKTVKIPQEWALIYGYR